MTTLTALKFDSADGANNALSTLKNLTKQQVIEIYDAAIVEWKEGKKKPKTRQLTNLVGIEAGWGALWGLLFGLLFAVPVLGAAVGAGFGALFGKLDDVGIDDDFIKSVKAEVTEGTSALFLLTGEATEDRVVAEMKQYNPEVISTNLSQEEEDKLRAAFEDEG